MLKHQRGFGIPELLIGIAVGMVIVAAAMSLLQVTLRSSNDNIKMARLEQDLRQTMQMLTRDLRRATTWDAATDVVKESLGHTLKLSAATGSVTVEARKLDPTTGAYKFYSLASIGSKAEGGTLIYVDSTGTVNSGTITNYSGGKYTVMLDGTWPANVIADNVISAGSWNILRPESAVTVSGTCVLFNYDFDTDDDGDYDVGRFGYRHRNDATAKSVQIRTSGDSTDTCTSGGTWENLTDPKVVEITTFSVADNSPDDVTNSGLTVSIREYTISVTGRLKAEPEVTRTLTETIRVRNDQVSL